MQLTLGRPVLLVVLVIAAVGGGVVSLSLSRLLAPDTAQVSKVRYEAAEAVRKDTVLSERGTDPRSGVLLGRIANELGAVAGRVEALEHAQAAQNSEDEAPPLEHLGSGVTAAHNEAWLHHSTEPVDSQWAPSTSRSVREDLERFRAEFGYQVTSAECRNDTCAVTLQWDSVADVPQLSPMAMKPFRANCERHFRQMEPTGGGSVEVRLLLNCSTWKTDGSKPFLVTTGD